jgi:hypothetical protein
MERSIDRDNLKGQKNPYTLPDESASSVRQLDSAVSFFELQRK